METLDSKIAALEIFNENSKKVPYYFPILQEIGDISHARATFWSCGNWQFTKNWLLKRLRGNFHFFVFSIIARPFPNIFCKNYHFLIWIFKVLLKFYYVTNFENPATFDSKMVVLWIRSKISEHIIQNIQYYSKVLEPHICYSKWVPFWKLINFERSYNTFNFLVELLKKEGYWNKALS